MQRVKVVYIIILLMQQRHTLFLWTDQHQLSNTALNRKDKRRDREKLKPVAKKPTTIDCRCHPLLAPLAAAYLHQ